MGQWVPKFQTLARVSGDERRLVFRAWWSCWVVAILFRTLGTVRCQRWLQGRNRPSATPDAEASGLRSRAEAVAWGLKVALRNIPWRVRCLERSLTLEWLLARAGIPSAIRIGVRKAEATAIEAHAWVEVAGEPLDDTTVGEHYLPFEGTLTSRGAEIALGRSE